MDSHIYSVTIFNDGETAVLACCDAGGDPWFESFNRVDRKTPISVEEFQRDFPRNATFEFNARRDGKWDFFQAGIDRQLSQGIAWG